MQNCSVKLAELEDLIGFETLPQFPNGEALLKNEVMLAEILRHEAYMGYVDGERVILTVFLGVDSFRCACVKQNCGVIMQAAFLSASVGRYLRPLKCLQKEFERRIRAKYANLGIIYATRDVTVPQAGKFLRLFGFENSGCVIERQKAVYEVFEKKFVNCRKSCYITEK